MYCPHCGSKINKEARFCPKCGQEIGKGITTKAKKNLGFLYFGLSVILSVLGSLVLSTNPQTGSPVAALIFIAAGFLYLGAVFEFFRWLFRKNKKLGFAALVVIIVISSLTVVYFQAKQAYLSQISQILDIGAEVAYAKSVGDDLVAGKKITDAGIILGKKSIIDVAAQEKIGSMAQVRSKLERELGRIKTRKVRPEIEPFRNSVETWTQVVLTASNFTNSETPTKDEKAKWQNLPSTPAVVAINLGGGQQVSALDTVANHVKQLQSAGDLAIASEDRSAMRLVAARAQMQSNFVDTLTSNNPDICSKRGCAPQVKSFIGGVHRSALGYVVGNQGAAKDWDNTWSEPPQIIAGAGQPLGGLGITQGSPDPTPPPNKPTTLRSVSPDYKPRQGSAPWDGRYTASTNVSCDTASSDFADSFADSAIAEFEVRGGKIIAGPSEIAIDDSGYANYSLSIEGISANINYYFVQTAGGGVSLSGDLNLSGGSEGFSISCSGSFSGQRS